MDGQGVTRHYVTGEKNLKETGRDCVYLNTIAKQLMNLGVLKTPCSNDVASDIRRNAFYTVKGNLVQNYLRNSIRQRQQLFYLLPAYFARSYMTGWERNFSKIL